MVFTKQINHRCDSTSIKISIQDVINAGNLGIRYLKKSNNINKAIVDN